MPATPASETCKKWPGCGVIRAAARPSACDVEIETAITALGGEPGGGLVVVLGGLPDRASIISAAARNNVPAVYNLSDFARDGGLLSYGADQVDIVRRAASYVDRILRGEKPGDLPVQFPTKFEMVVTQTLRPILKRFAGRLGAS